MTITQKGITESVLVIIFEFRVNSHEFVGNYNILSGKLKKR